MNEIKRLQQLAGILSEIKINDPSPIKDGDRVEILTNVYYNGEEAIPEYEIEGNIEDYDLYINKGETGEYYDGGFESDEGSNTRIDPKYLKKI
jgi:hypothetical protein